MSRSRKNRKRQGRTLNNFLSKPTIVVTYAFNKEAGGWVGVISHRNTMVDMVISESLEELVTETQDLLSQEFAGEYVNHTVDRESTTIEDQTLIALYLSDNNL